MIFRENIHPCFCLDAPSSVYGVGKEKGDWVPFLERKDIIVWRKVRNNNAQSPFINFSKCAQSLFSFFQL